MKAKVFGARRRLSQLVTRAENLGIDLQNSSSATVLRKTCDLKDPSSSASLLVLGLSLLTLFFALTVGQPYLRFGPVHCTSNRTQELHIQTLSWRLPLDEGVESTDPDLKNGLSDSTEQSSGNSPFLQLDDCEDLGQFYEKCGHRNV